MRLIIFYGRIFFMSNYTHWTDIMVENKTIGVRLPQ